MEKLRSLALSSRSEQRLTDSGTVAIESLKIHFPAATPRHLLDESLSKTYRSKPLVLVNNEALFGELAILRYLQMDGWDGVWIDTFHGRGRRKVFWSNLPPSGHGILSVEAESLYDKIIVANSGKSSGFFDVFAWKNGVFIFLEYKGEGDSSNRNEKKWINTAIKCGIPPENLFFVTY